VDKVDTKWRNGLLAVMHDTYPTSCTAVDVSLSKAVPTAILRSAVRTKPAGFGSLTVHLCTADFGAAAACAPAAAARRCGDGAEVGRYVQVRKGHSEHKLQPHYRDAAVAVGAHPRQPRLYEIKCVNGTHATSNLKTRVDRRMRLDA
jgi:hypothetical protein